MSFRTQLYRGVPVYLDKRHTKEIMDAVQSGSTTSLKSAVQRAMESNARDAWWSLEATDSNGAGRWWSSSKSVAAGYSGGHQFWRGQSYFGIGVVLTIDIDDDEWSDYAEADGRGVYWYRVPAGLPLSIVNIDAYVPSRDQVASMAEEIIYQEDVVSRFGGEEEPSFAEPDDLVSIPTSIRAQTSKTSDRDTEGDVQRRASSSLSVTAAGKPIYEMTESEFRSIERTIMYHVTSNEQDYQTLLREGVRMSNVPMTRARRTFMNGEQTTFAPGNGAGMGLYASPLWWQVTGYGRYAVAIEVHPGEYEIPPEHSWDEHYTMDFALRDADGVLITKDIPASRVHAMFPGMFKFVPNDPYEAATDPRNQKTAASAGKIGDIAEYFAQEHPALGSPEGAMYQCEDMSTAFERAVRANDSSIEVKHIYADHPTSRFDREHEDWGEWLGADGYEGDPAHSATLIEGMVYDFTARQFWPSSPFPLIEGLDTYRRRWVNFDVVGSRVASKTASADHPVVRGITLTLDGPERTEVARKIVDGTVTARDILFAVHSYDGHAGNWWGPNDGYNWSIEDSKTYAYTQEFPQDYVDRFDENNGGEIAVILVGRTDVDLTNEDYFGDNGYFLDDFTRVRLDEVHYEDANGWHVLPAPSDLQALARTAARLEDYWEWTGEGYEREAHWAQPYDELLSDALYEWKGSNSSLSIWMNHVLTDPSYPASNGTAKIWKAQATAIIDEVRNGAPAPTLYRGDSKEPTGIRGWSANIETAQRFADMGGGDIWVLDGARGIEIERYAPGSGLNSHEEEWIVEVRPGEAKIEQSLRLTAALDNEARVSVAEHVMENFGYTGRTWHLLEGHVDDPAYNEVMAPLRDFVSRVVGERVNVHVSNFNLDREGGAQAMVTGTGTMYVRPTVSTLTILHECAHILNRTTHNDGHNEGFIQTVAELYDTHLGPDASRKFLDIALPA